MAARRGIWKWLRRIINLTIASLLALALIGRIVRDRNVAFALMMYMPLLPIGLIAMAADGVQRGRAVPRIRFALLGAGSVATALSLHSLVSWGSAAAVPMASLRLLQWNVQWGGPERSKEEWSATASQIIAQQPDVIILNEAPVDASAATLCAQLPGQWQFIVHEEQRFNPYYRIRLLIASRWKVSFQHSLSFPNGGGVIALIETPTRRLRVLAVDGISNPRVLRTPLLHAVAQCARQASDNGEPIDIIAGDFNSPGNSIGFDELRRGGYTAASTVGRGWIGTYPSECPLYDIDHVWLIETLSPLARALIRSPATNHLGQLTELN